MIVGIGTDIVQIERIKHLLLEYGNMFVDRILHINEREIFYKLADKLNINYLAKRFAGKEAFSKAIGSGIGEVVSFNDIAILNDNMGRPELFVNREDVICSKYKVHISLSDDYPIALAFVVVSI